MAKSAIRDGRQRSRTAARPQLAGGAAGGAAASCVRPVVMYVLAGFATVCNTARQLGTSWLEGPARPRSALAQKRARSLAAATGKGAARSERVPTS
eukprot:190732-Chlamydomonas_euryale.AAC.2